MYNSPTPLEAVFFLVGFWSTYVHMGTALCDALLAGNTPTLSLIKE